MAPDYEVFMITKLQGLLEQIQELQERVTEEISREAEEFGYTVRQRRVFFERQVARHHRALAKRLSTYLAESSWPVMATAPLVYGLLPPLLLLDGVVWLYQGICFPIYGIERVRRSDYLLLDRHRLQYLNAIERGHCLYCGYVNGLLAYVREVAARTEQYWCPIKHAQPLSAPHARYHRFLTYGDAEHYAAELQRLRGELGKLS